MIYKCVVSSYTETIYLVITVAQDKTVLTRGKSDI